MCVSKGKFQYNIACFPRNNLFNINWLPLALVIMVTYSVRLSFVKVLFLSFSGKYPVYYSFLRKNIHFFIGKWIHNFLINMFPN